MVSSALRPAAIAALIDHSLLRPELTAGELEAGCLEAREAGVASVCLLPYFVPEAASLLAHSSTVVSTVVAFPHGSVGLRAKLAECEAALADGARELDVVVNVSLVLSQRWQQVSEEIRSLTTCCHDRGAKLKLIFETCYLAREDKVRLCELASEARVDWVKTSTGFGTSGATVEDVRLMRQLCPPAVQVKASGGIGTLGELLEFQRLGASRIGTSRTARILAELARGESERLE